MITPTPFPIGKSNLVRLIGPLGSLDPYLGPHATANATVALRDL
jgi:hypothetical protein